MRAAGGVRAARPVSAARLRGLRALDEAGAKLWAHLVIVVVGIASLRACTAESTIYAVKQGAAISIRFNITFQPNAAIARFSIYPFYLGASADGLISAGGITFAAKAVAGIPGWRGYKTFQLDSAPTGIYNFSSSDDRVKFVVGPYVAVWVQNAASCNGYPCTSPGVTYVPDGANVDPPENAVAVSPFGSRQGPNSETTLEAAAELPASGAPTTPATTTGTTGTAGGTSDTTGSTGGTNNNNNGGPPKRLDSTPIAVGAGLGGLAVLIATIIIVWLLMRRSRRSGPQPVAALPPPLEGTTSSGTRKTESAVLEASATGSTPVAVAFHALRRQNGPGPAPSDRRLADRATCVSCGREAPGADGDDEALVAACPACRVPLAVHRRFFPLAKIGGGEFGTVFLAIDLHSPSRRKCVIKKFSFFAHNSNEEHIDKAAELFLEEGRVLEQLSHPRIPKLLGSFSWRGDLFNVMEFVPGRDLQRVIRDASSVFSESQVLCLMEDVLEALDYVHGRRVLHRDVKPSNIIAGEDGYYHLVDFGLSTTWRPDWEQATEIGTYAYADPEQRRGYPTASSDLYSLAATCVELVTRARPTHEYFCNWTPPRTLTVSESLAAILQRMLARDPAARFESAAAVRAALAVGRPPLAHVRAAAGLAPAPSATSGGRPSERGVEQTLGLESAFSTAPPAVAYVLPPRGPVAPGRPA